MAWYIPTQVPHDVRCDGRFLGDREIARAGRSVTVLDPDDRPDQAWRASAGLLTPQIDARPDDPLLELGIAGREYYRERAGELKQEAGVDIELVDHGVLRLALGEAEVAQLRASVAWQRQHGHATDWLDPVEVRSDWPWVGETDGGLWAPHDGAVNPVRLVDALRASARALGVRFIPDPAIGLDSSGRRIIAVRSARGTYPAGDIVLAVGAWTGRLAGLPRPVSVEPVRGQIVARRWPPSVRPGIICGSHGQVGQRNGEAICGATVEHAQQKPRTTMNPAALVTRNGAHAVFVVREDRAVETGVRIGDRIGDFVEVLEGVKPGDRIVLRPVEKIRNGAKIREAETR